MKKLIIALALLLSGCAMYEPLTPEVVEVATVDHLCSHWAHRADDFVLEEVKRRDLDCGAYIASVRQQQAIASQNLILQGQAIQQQQLLRQQSIQHTNCTTFGNQVNCLSY